MLMHLAEGFPDAVAKLTMQYRMNVDICHFSNLVAYKGLLKCGNETVANQRLRLPIKPKLEMNHNKGLRKLLIQIILSYSLIVRLKRSMGQSTPRKYRLWRNVFDRCRLAACLCLQ